MKISKFDAAAKTAVRVIVCAAIVLVFFRNAFPSLDEAVVLESVPVFSGGGETEEFGEFSDSAAYADSSETAADIEASGSSSELERDDEPSAASETSGFSSESPAEPPASPQRSDRQDASSNDEPEPAVHGKININTATSAQLQTLSGIGEVKANAIIAYREQYGEFSDINELTKVSGIGEKTLEKIRGDITV